MRQKSVDKQKALLKATLNLVNSKGFHDAPMSQIAKLAGVSPATIYLYFENKQDLINKLYLEIKEGFSNYAFRDYSGDLPVKKAFEIIWYNIADYKFHRMEEAAFLSQCDNTPIIGQEVREEGLKHLQPLLDLWKRGQEEGVIKSLSSYLLYAYSVYPLSFLVAITQRDGLVMDKKMLTEAFDAAWDSIRL